MTYRTRIIPDYCALILSLKEILDSVIYQLEEDDRMGVDPTVSFLEAADNLDQQLSAMRRDLGL